MDHHAIEPRQAWLQAAEDPAREHFAGRVLQPLDLVEVLVIQLLEQRSECGLDVGEVHHPAHGRVRFAFDMNLHPERMPVQPCTLVPGRHVGQPMRRLDLEHFMDVHDEPLYARPTARAQAGKTGRMREARRRRRGGYGWTRTTDPSIMSAVL